jgi:hypothetical protein
MMVANLPLGLVFQSILLSWIFKIRKCSCSANWRREYIMYCSFASMAFALLLFSGRVPHKYLVMLSLPMVAVGIVNFYSILSYIPMLKKKCDCATKGDWRDDFIYWWVLASLIFTGVMVVLAFSILGYRKFST